MALWRQAFAVLETRLWDNSDIPGLQWAYRGTEQVAGRGPRLSFVSSDRVGKETTR